MFVDIDADTFNLDPAAAAAAITPRTKAIIPVHLFGQCADLDADARRCRAARASPSSRTRAQAIGAEYQGGKAGGIGAAIGCFSFFPSKNLGRLRRRRPGHHQRRRARRTALRLIRNHGMEPKYYHHMVGGNFRIDALQAAVLRVKLPHLAAWSEAPAPQRRALPPAFAGAGLDGRVSVPLRSGPTARTSTTSS